MANTASPAGNFDYQYSWYGGSFWVDQPASRSAPGVLTDHNSIQNDYDDLGRLTSTRLSGPGNVLRNEHDYQLNAAHQRTRQTFNDGNPSGSTHYSDYTYDNLGQLKTARGTDHAYDYAVGDFVDTPRLQEQFGYAYDAAWNLNRRTNNALIQTFGVNTLNELTNATRSGTLTVAGLASGRKALYAGDYGITNVTVSGTGLTTGNANLYADGSWAKAGATLADGNNTYSATAKDTYDRTASDTINLSLPSTINFQYDYNGNLTNDGRRVFEYDFENQLTNVYVASAWRSAFLYDAFGRRRIRKEYTWQSSAWVLTNEVRYVYDGMLVVQERDANNLALVSYTRGNDLSGSLQGAGGIGGLLARTDNGQLIAGNAAAHAYYHCDGNGNITALVDTNGFVVARYQYDPYGNLLGMSGPLAEANVYRFSSKEWHDKAGIYYYGFRYYEPNLQRWLNRDPIGQAGGINLYVFVGNNGMFWIDAYGLHWTDHIPDILIDPGTINFFAGMGDNLSFGLTDMVRDGFDLNDAVNKCAGAYTAGQWTGEALQTAIGGAAGWKAAGKAVKGASKGLEGATEFSHSIKASRFGRDSALDKFLTKTKLNGNYVSRERHYLHDAERFPINKELARELWGDKWPAPLQALDRIPKFPAGALIGANAGDASRRNQTGGCP